MEKIYKCMFCGKMYENEDEYVSCINACYKKQKEDREKAKRIEIQKKKEIRSKALNDTYHSLVKQIQDWVNDYDDPIPLPTHKELEYLWWI